MMPLVPLLPACIAHAAVQYAVPEADLWGLLAVEHGWPGAAQHNQNGTDDLGPFQINSIWVTTFTHHWAMPSPDITYVTLRDNGCWSAYAGAAIYQVYLHEAEGDRTKAITWYHSHDTKLGAAYLRRFEQQYFKLFGSPEAVAR